MTNNLTYKERVLATINLQKTDRVPCCVTLNYFIARHAGVTIADFIKNPSLQRDIGRRVFEELGGFDYPIFMPGDMFDLNSFVFLPVKVKRPGKELPDDVIPQFEEMELMPPEGYDVVIQKGWQRYVEEDLIPVVFPELTRPTGGPKGPPAQTEEDRRFWEAKQVFMPGGVPPVSLPYEVFSYARSLEKFSIDLYRRPEKIIAATEAVFPELMNITLEVAIPPGPVTIAANRFSNGFISPKQFERFAFPYLKKAVEMLVSRGFTVFFHFDQSWTRFLPYFLQFPEGKYVFHFDGLTDMFKAKEILGKRMCLMGDVPATLFKLGTPPEVEAYCKKLIDGVGKGGGFILAPGCGIPDDAKFENVKAMVDTARNYLPQ